MKETFPLLAILSIFAATAVSADCLSRSRGAHESVIQLIQDAQAGQGLVLDQFAKVDSITTDKAAEIINQANRSGELCQNSELMTYDEILALASSR